MKIRIRPIIFLAIFLAVVAVYVLSPKTQTVPIGTLYLIFPVGGALIGLYASGIYGFKSANGRAMLLIAGGSVCWGVADTIRYVLDVFGVSSDIAPSLASAFLLLAYPIFGVGIYQGFVAAGINLKKVKKSLLAVVLSVSLILTILVMYFGVYQAYDPTADALTNTVNISYGLGDLVLVIGSLLAILVANEYKGGKLALFWKIMTSGFLLFLIGDILYFTKYGVLAVQDIKPYVYIELIWIAAYLILAYGMLENYLHVSAVQKNIKLKLQQRK